MAVGLVALLDDIAAIARLAAASLDDVGAASMKASAKAMGVVVDDAAVTPKYVSGLTPARELPIIWKIAKGSLRNKVVFLLPGALLLSAFLPWLITPLLMIGGLYLSYEGAEKIIESLLGHAPLEEDDRAALTPAEVERHQVVGAVRTDLILSAEIMAIALSQVADQPIATRALALVAVSVLITGGVYGVVGLIVKMDDIGLHLARRHSLVARRIGRALVAAMPIVLSLLAKVGTAAMLWVGGSILVHGLEEFHWESLPHAANASSHALAGLTPFAPGIGAWLGYAAACALMGIVTGGLLAVAVPQVGRLFGKGHH